MSLVPQDRIRELIRILAGGNPTDDDCVDAGCALKEWLVERQRFTESIDMAESTIEGLHEKWDRDAGLVAVLRTQRNDLVEAMQKLTRKLQEVHADPQFQSVWAAHQIHCGQYHGPSYAKELERAQAVLGAMESKA